MDNYYDDEAAQFQAQDKQGVALESTYKQCLERYGVADDVTLTAAFLYIDHLILVYRLADCDAMLAAIHDVCRAKEQSNAFYIKHVQALAFLRFKQARFEESVELFEKQLRETEESVALLENMGHAYNSISNDAKAESCFHRALELMKELKKTGKTTKSSRGGILLGLGTVKQNRGDHAGALPHLMEAVEWFKAQHENETSLQAKASTSVARALDELGKREEAERYYRDAVRIFTAVCGADSPLTVNALAKLGMQLYARNLPEAEQVCHDAYVGCCALEKDSLRISTIATLLVQLHNIRAKNIDSLIANAKVCAGSGRRVLTELAKLGPLPENPDFAVFYKALAEDVMLLKQYKLAAEYFETAIRLLTDIPGPEAQQLREVCNVLLVSGCYARMNTDSSTSSTSTASTSRKGKKK